MSDGNAKKRKVLHVCFSRSWGGLEKNSFDLALAQKKAGYDVLYACRKGFSLERELVKTGMPVLAFANIVPYADIRIVLAMRRLVRKYGFKTLHATHTEDLGLAFPAVCGIKEAKLFFTLQMNVAGPKKDLYHRLEYSMIKRIFVSSPVLRDSAVKYLPITKDRIMVMPYGIDVGLYRPARDDAFRAEQGWTKDTIVLGILARLDPPKGQFEAIQAMPAILMERPSARLVLVGDESVDHKGAETKRLHDEVAKLGLGNVVTFIGDKRGAEQAKFLNAMDVFLSPSHFETYSTSMIMAQLCAIPIVGTNAGGTPEQLGFGKYGEIVEPSDPASLAQGILRVLGNIEAAKKRALEYSVIAKDRFDMNRIVERIAAEYDR